MKMFTYKVGTVRCFLCFCKKNTERTFHAHSTICPGSVEPLKEVIEDLARSAKLELQLSEDTLLCFECCKILATFIEQKRDLLDRIEKAMKYFDNELDEEPIIKEENLCGAEAQDPFLDNAFEKDHHASLPAKITDFIEKSFIDNKLKLEIDDENKNNFTENESSLVLEHRIEDEHANPGEEKTFVEVNFYDNENIQHEQVPLIVIHDEERKFKCDLCNFDHYSESHVILHKNIHRGLKETQCPRCLKILSRIGSCIRHMETQPNCWKYPAKQKTIADTMNEMEENSLMVTGEEENTYKCDLCDFAHQNENHLILHKGTHKGLKETQCPFCLKLFSGKSKCLRHMIETHIYSENQCEKCGLCFTKLSSLNNHKLQHDTEENPLLCTICKQQFKTIKTFKRHALTHRKDRPRYTCENCGKVFVDRRAYKIHLQTKHRKANQEKQDTNE